MSLHVLTQDVADSVLRRLLRKGGDFAELFAEDRRSLSLRLEDRQVEEVCTGVDRGASLRLNVRNIQTLSVAEVCGLPLDEAQRCSAIYSCADLLHLPILKTKRERATILRKQLSEVTALAKEPAQYRVSYVLS